jgi:hypothetical protein
VNTESEAKSENNKEGSTESKVQSGENREWSTEWKQLAMEQKGACA